MSRFESSLDLPFFFALILSVPLVLVFSANRACAQASFVELPSDITVYRVSRDGTLAGGRRQVSNTLHQSVLVDSANVATAFGSNLWGAGVTSISADGSVLSYRDASGAMLLVDGVATPLPAPPPPYTAPGIQDISADGNTLVGVYSEAPSVLRGFRFDRPTGTYERLHPMYAIGDFEFEIDIGFIEAISSDGSTIVGWTSVPFENLTTEAVAYDRSGQAEFLGHLENGAIDFSGAQGVNADGSVIVGLSWGPVNHEVMIWENGVFEEFGVLGEAMAVSGDGTRVVGSACLGPAPSGCTGSESEAFYWTRALGFRRLGEVLEDEYGLDLEGYSIRWVNDVSDDGLVMVGGGRNAAGDSGSWVLRLGQTVEAAVPEPQLALQLSAGLLLMGAFSRRQRVPIGFRQSSKG